MKTIFVLILSLFVAVFSPPSGSSEVSAADGGKKFQCPMKCEGAKTYDAPGKCPVCNMNLREVSAPADAPKSDTSDGDSVKVVGAMMNVMHKGELFGTIALESITRKDHLYGLGPVEYLKGEIMIMDGHAYVSRVVPPKSMKVEETYAVKAPFFVYANVDRWKEVAVPASVTNVARLEAFLKGHSKDDPKPFAFKVTGRVKRATIHVVNLPKGSTVASPEDAHRGEQKFSLRDREVDIVGFFSREHKGVFTHHDTFVHMHLITSDRKMMGHLEEAGFVKGKIRVYLPA